MRVIRPLKGTRFQLAASVVAPKANVGLSAAVDCTTTTRFCSCYTASFDDVCMYILFE